MSTRLRIQSLLRSYLPRYGEPPGEHVTDAVERVWQAIETDAAHTAPGTTASAFTVASALLGRRSSQSEGGRRKPRDLREHWIPLAAAAVVVIAAVGTAIVWQPADNALFRVADGAVHDEGGTIRSNGGGAGAVLVLTDGSRVEMRSRSELSLERADDGLRIRLIRGGIIVDAAIQRTGHLYVQTKEVTVSVVGTVFLVNADEHGSRVAVIEGEVRVQQGATEKNLLPGEQVTTNPTMARASIKEEIAWARNAPILVGLLQQAAVTADNVAPQNPAPLKPSFEVISIRSSGSAPAAGGRGAGGLPSYAPYTIACSGVNFSQLDPGRLSMNYVTVLTLILRAYGPADRNCTSFTSQSQGLTGGPAWVYSEQFNVEARIPQGTPAYTLRQFENNNAPVLQAMLRTALEDRFKLLVRRETKELPVEILKLGTTRNATQLEELAAVTMSKSPDKAGFDGLFERVSKGLETLKEGLVSTEGDGLWGINASMSEVVSYLGRLTGKPVLDRTGLMTRLMFHLQYDRVPDGLGAFQGYMRPLAPASVASLRRALREQLGLELESGTAPVEVLVIERVERLSEN